MNDKDLTMKSVLSKSISNLIFVTSLCIIAGIPVVQADDNLNMIFTTADAGGKYDNRHIHVVWLATTSGSFVSTAGTNVGNQRTVWANARKDSFETWWTPARQEDIDARTGATQTSYRTYNLNWNFERLDGSVIPDGTYRLYLECTNSDSGLPRNFTYFTITKGDSAWSMGPTTQGRYNNVTLTFTPAGLGVANTGATEVTSTSSRLNGQVTGTFGENPQVYIYWGDEDGGTTAGNWDNEVSLGTMGEVPFYTDVSGLSYGGTYYYRCYVRDPSTGVWAASTESFQAVTVTTVFEEGDTWLYFKGYSTPSNWKALGLTDFTGWLSGPTGIGYGDSDDNTVLSDMEDNYLTVYMRYEFQVDYPADVSSLIFRVDYDDGFVAFINGQEVARSENMPQGQNLNTEADPDHEAGEPEVFDISSHASKLEPGKNAFAIEVHNTGISSSDLSMIPELVMTGGVGEPQSNIALEPELLNFSLVDVGTYSDLTFDIMSIGSLPLQINSLEVVGFDKAAYSLVSPPALPFVLPATGMQTITTRFAPTADRACNYASVAVGSDAVSRLVASVSLRGTGLTVAEKSLFVAGSVGGSSNAVAVSGNYAIIGQGATLAIVDISDPCEPAAVGQVRLDDVIQRIAVQGDMAYAASGSSGLMPVDISDPFSPVALNAEDTPGFAYDVAADGSTLCVADGPGGVAVYDISTPSQPTLRITYDTQGSATAGVVSGTTVYLLDDQLGLQIVDVAGILPILLGSCDEIELGRAITLHGSHACITDSLGNLLVVDVTHAATPVLRGQSRLIGEGCSLSVSNSGSDDVAFIAAGKDGIERVHMVDLDTLEHLGVHDTSGQASDLVAVGPWIYLADGSGGFKILNSPDASGPMTESSDYQLQSSPYAAAVHNNSVHVAAGSSGLHTMDLSTPNEPVMLGVLDTMLEADIQRDDVVNFFDVARLAKNWLAAGASLEGDIYKDNVVDPRDVAKLAADWLISDALDEVKDIEISGATAYLANGRSGFQIVDISSPTEPIFLGDYATTGPACSVAVNGQKAIVADGVGVYLLDVANSLAPSVTGQWVSVWAHDVAIDSSYGYVANGGSGLAILNSSDASQVSSYDTPGVAFAVAVAGNTVYVADGPGGVQVLDVSAPAAPSLISNFITDSSAVGVEIVGSRLYVATDSGITVVDVSDPGHPVLYAKSEIPVKSLSTALSGSQIVASDNKGGLAILDITDYVPPPPGEASTPNPPDGSVNVRITPLLSWEPGAGATSHNVYLGKTNPPEFRGNQTGTSFQAEPLTYGFKYYWRIDEVNANGITTGPVWTFTTQTGGGR